MSYIIEHAFDNEYTSSRLDVGQDDTKRRVQREKSKNRLTFRLSEGRLGEVFVLSGDSSNKQKGGDSVMGFGAPNLVLDEAALVDDQIESKIFRMLGDSMDNFYCKIGNPFKRNHFLKSSRDPRYYQIDIGYKIGLKEGRVNEEFIEEARGKPNFGVLYENKFPEADSIDEKGWSQLLLDKELELAKATVDKSAYIGTPKLGVDVARGGGCENVWVLRTKNYAKVLAKSKMSDTMKVASTTLLLAREHGVNEYNTFVDDTGVGGGVVDRLRQMRFFCQGVKCAAKPDDQTMYINRRAENYWRSKNWIVAGGKVCEEDDWSSLLDNKYKAQDTSGKIQIMSKLEMAKEGIDSPDVADAFMLTFDKPAYYKEDRDDEEDFDPYDIM